MPQRANGMGISDLDGFLTGLVVGPELIMPSKWLPEIWGHEEPKSKREVRVHPVRLAVLRLVLQGREGGKSASTIFLALSRSTHATGRPRHVSPRRSRSLLPVLNAARYSMSAALRASSSRKIASGRGSYVTVSTNRPMTRGGVL